MSYLLTTLTKKEEVDSIIRSTIDKVLVLRFGRASDSTSLLLDDVLAKSSRDVSKFATVALVDVDSDDVQVYLHYFDITLIPSTVFFFNAHHMKMDSGTADHTKWIGAFRTKQDFIDVVEAIFRGAMKGKLIVNCPLPPERIPKYQFYEAIGFNPFTTTNDSCSLCYFQRIKRKLKKIEQKRVECHETGE
ncbi:hypothetical protein ACLB2K_022514 [Fragaria x ananassa]